MGAPKPHSPAGRTHSRFGFIGERIAQPGHRRKKRFPTSARKRRRTRVSQSMEESSGSDLYRRGLYIFRKRTMPYPQLITFDAPDALTVCVRRERSTTPLQALILLNDPVFVEAAQGLATSILREVRGDVGQRVDYLFQKALGRPPNSLEKDKVTSYYRAPEEHLVKRQWRGRWSVPTARDRAGRSTGGCGLGEHRQRHPQHG